MVSSRAPPPGAWKAGWLTKPSSCDHQSGQEQGVEHPLLHTVGQRVEAGQVGEDGQDVADVLLGHADPVGGAVDEVVGVAGHRDVIGPDLVLAAQEPVAVDDRSTGDAVADHRLGDAAREGRGVGASADRQPVVAVGIAGSGTAVVGQVQRYLERALDPPRHAFPGRVVGRLLELGDLERGCLAVQLGEGVVAEVQHALGQPPSRGDREVPRQVQVVALDVDAGEVGDHALDPRSEGLDLVHLGRRAIADHLEHRRRRNGLIIRVAQVAEADDVPVSLVEVDRRSDDQRLPLGVGHVGVELGPERYPDAAVGIEQHHRGVILQRRRHIGHRRQAAGLGIEAWHHREHGRARAEPVQPVPLGRVDRNAGRIGRHLLGLQSQPDRVAGSQIVVTVHRFGVGREPVAGIGQQTRRSVQQLTPGGLAVDHVLDGRQLLGRGRLGRDCGGRRRGGRGADHFFGAEQRVLGGRAPGRDQGAHHQRHDPATAAHTFLLDTQRR